MGDRSFGWWKSLWERSPGTPFQYVAVMLYGLNGHQKNIVSIRNGLDALDLRVLTMENAAQCEVTDLQLNTYLLKSKHHLQHDT